MVDTQIAPDPGGGTPTERSDAGTTPVPLVPPEEKPVEPKVAKQANEGAQDTGKKWSLTEMGRFKWEEIEQKEIVSLYTPLVGEMISHLTQFEADGHRLSEEQAKFLDLFGKEITKTNLGERETLIAQVLSTEAGMMATHTMVELEMLDQLIALGKNIALKAENQPDRQLRVKIRLREMKSFLVRLGDNASGVWESLAGVFGKGLLRNGEIDLSAVVGLDLDGLPEEHREYIKWSQMAVSEEEFSEFVLGAGEATFKFYKALKVDVAHLNALTPWERLKLTEDVTMTVSREGISQNFAAAWIRYRAQKFEELGGIGGALDKRQRLELFFKAQQATVSEFTDRRLREINSSEKGVLYKDSIEVLSERRDKITGPEAVSKKKSRLDETRSNRQKQIEAARSEVLTNETEKATTQKLLTESRPKLPAMLGERGRLEKDLEKFRKARNAVDEQYRHEYMETQRQLNAALGDRTTYSNILSNWNRRETMLKGAIEVFDKGKGGKPGLDALESQYRELSSKIESVETNERRVQYLTDRNTELETHIEKWWDEIDILEEQIKVGIITPADKERAGRLDVAVRALDRLGSMQGQLNNTDARARSKYSLENFTDNDINVTMSSTLGKPVSNGYMAFVDLIFDPKMVKGKDQDQMQLYKRAMEVLTPDLLAHVLMTKFGISAPTSGDVLEHAFAQIRAKKMMITDAMLKETFLYVLNEIEQQSLLI